MFIVSQRNHDDGSMPRSNFQSWGVVKLTYFYHFKSDFGCSRLICELTSSLLIIMQGKYRILKDEVDDFDDVMQQLKSCCWLFTFFTFDSVAKKQHVYTMIPPFGLNLMILYNYNVSALVHFRYACTHPLTFYVEVIEKNPYP